MTLIFDLRPRSFHQVVSLSWTIDQRNDRETAECAFSDIFRHDEISTPIELYGKTVISRKLPGRFLKSLQQLIQRRWFQDNFFIKFIVLFFVKLFVAK